MSEGVQELLYYMLDGNVALVSFLGVAFLLVHARGARKSLNEGLAYAAAVTLAGLIGSLVAANVPGGAPAELATFLVVALVSVAALQAGGHLTDTHYGLPSALFATPLLFGTPYIIHGAGLNFELTVAAAAGAGLGVYLTYVLTANMHEQIMISESKTIMKGTPAVVIALGILALGFMGFNFL